MSHVQQGALANLHITWFNPSSPLFTSATSFFSFILLILERDRLFGVDRQSEAAWKISPIHQAEAEPERNPPGLGTNHFH
jgi:hypothetical protein